MKNVLNKSNNGDSKLHKAIIELKLLSIYRLQKLEIQTIMYDIYEVKELYLIYSYCYKNSSFAIQIWALVLKERVS